MGQIVSDVTDVLESRDNKKNAQNARQQLLSQMAKDEQAKTNLVKKALATQRAKYGASGASGKSMSSDAVLKRLAKETSQPYEDKRESNLSKLKSTKAKKSNLLKSILSRFDDLLS